MSDSEKPPGGAYQPGSTFDATPASRRSVTATRADLADAVYRKVGLSRIESAALVEMVLDEISDALGRGENVKLSSFGSFRVRSKGTRIGRNPKTGVEVPITPRRVLVFKPSNVMKAVVNGTTPEDEDD
jgi:integration host factor subunit alpha